MVDSLHKNRRHNFSTVTSSGNKINSTNKKQKQKRNKEETFFIINKKSKKQIIKRWLKRFFYFLFFVMTASLLMVGLFLIRFSHSSKKIIINNSSQSFSESRSFLATTKLAFNLIKIKQKNFQDIDLRGKNRGQINILLLGIAGKGKAGTNLTDTIMIMSINLKKQKIALLSLPRDFYYNNQKYQKGAKINSLYQIGINEEKGVKYIKEAVEDVTYLPIDYYFILDFAGFEKAIDEIGGIDVYAERDYYDTRYPGPNYSYETFSLEKGWHHLDGATALKYARERHSDPEGDFGRAKRQQQVIQAVKNKFFSQKHWLNVFTLNKILGTLENNLKTNISLDEIDDFVFLAYHLDTQNIINKVIDAWKPDSLLRVDHIEMGGVRAFVLVPKKGYQDYSEIRKLAKDLFQ